MHQGHYLSFSSGVWTGVKKVNVHVSGLYLGEKGRCVCAKQEEMVPLCLKDKHFVTRWKQRVFKGRLNFSDVLLIFCTYCCFSASQQSISHSRTGPKQNWEPLLTPGQQIYSFSCCLATLVSSRTGGWVWPGRQRPPSFSWVNGPLWQSLGRGKRDSGTLGWWLCGVVGTPSLSHSVPLSLSLRRTWSQNVTEQTCLSQKNLLLTLLGGTDRSDKGSR